MAKAGLVERSGGAGLRSPAVLCLAGCPAFAAAHRLISRWPEPRALDDSALSTKPFGRYQRMQLAAHQIEHHCVITGFALPEQPRGRIPGAVIAAEQPAIVGIVGQENPGRPAKCC